jgi:protoporphyrinogen oxidase
MYVSEPRYLMARIQEPRHRSPFVAPPGKTSLMLEIPCTVGDDVWSAPDQAIYERVMDDLADLGFRDLRRATIGHFASFVEEGYPIYHLDYQDDRKRLLGFVGETANLVSCGRQGAFRYIFMDTAMEMGLAAANAVLDQSDRRASIAELRSERGLVEAAALTA